MKQRMKRMMSALLAAILLCTLLPVTAFAYSSNNYGQIVPTGYWAYDLSSSWSHDSFWFRPTTTGYYTFYSYGRSSGDPFGLLSSSGNYSAVTNALANAGCRSSDAMNYSLAYNDDGNGDLNYSFTYLCYAGQTYYYFMSKYNTGRTIATGTISNVSYNQLNLNRNGGSGGSTYYLNQNGVAWLYTNSSSSTNYITVPTRPNYTFTGYYNTSAATGGTQYIDSSGYINPVGRNASGTLYARWQQNVYTLTLNNQGAPNTSQTIGAGNALPASIAVPTRTGYAFNGYYTTATGGTQYYTASGARNTSAVMNGNITLYAQWSPKQYTITYNGMTGASANNPSTHTYGTTTSIANPTKDEYTFMGWSVNGGNSQTKGLILSATGYTSNITLTANWKKQTDVTIEDDNDLTANNEANQADLAKAFEHPVEDPTVGVTSDEMSNNASVKLTLSVTNTVASTAGEEAIKKASQGEVVKFFDAKVTKEVTDLVGTTSTTSLKEIPVPVAVSIPLTGNLADKDSYMVYRYHSYIDKNNAPVNEIHQISNDPSNPEYFEVVGNEIVIHTRMFSLFAVAAGETTLNIIPPNEGGTGDNAGVDVQGKITQADIQAVYKLDVSWGPMVFKFTTAREWDPNNHVYGQASYKWSDDSFTGGNNEIIMTNHSNADVYADMSFVREAGQLEETDVSFRSVNADTGPAAVTYYLPKVAVESGDPPVANSYLWLSGTPKAMPGGVPPAGGETAVTKVGTITITFAADTSAGLTPKTT